MSVGNENLINGFSCSLTSGICLIKGKSGCGKSTLVDVLLGFSQSIGQGSVSLFGKDIYSLKSNERTQYVFSQCSYMGQSASLLYSESLERNLKILNDSKLSWDNVNRLSNSLKFNLMDRSLITLSGGERQKAEIIACLSKERPVYILDEPLSSLEKESRQVLKEELFNLSKNHLVMIVDHTDIFDGESVEYILKFDKGNIHLENNAKEDLNLLQESNSSKDRRFLSPFISFKSFVKTNKLDFSVKSIILLAIFIFFGLMMSFYSSKTNNGICASDILGKDPFEYHRVSLASVKGEFDEDILDLVEQGDIYESFALTYSGYEAIDESSYATFNESIVFVTFENDQIQDGVFYIKESNYDYLSNSKITIGDETITIASVTEGILPDLIGARSVFDGYDRGNSLIAASPSTYRMILENGGFKNINIDNGHIGLPMNFKVSDKSIVASSPTNHVDEFDFKIIDSDEPLMKIKGLSKGTSIDLCSNDGTHISSFLTTHDSTGENEISIRTYREMLFSTSGYASMYYGGFDYSFLADKETMRKMVDAGLDLNLTFKKDLLGFSQSEGNLRLWIYLYVTVGLCVCYLIYIVFSRKGLRRWVRQEQGLLQI